MKKLLFALLLAGSLIGICAIAQINYNNAIAASIMSEGSDSAIEEAMRHYGFNVAWDEDIYMIDKIAALFNKY